MTEIYVASSILSAAVAVAALKASGADSGSDNERVLVVVNSSPAPEIVIPWHRTAAAGPLLEWFDRLVYLNELLHPYHPGAWHPGPEDLPILERLLRSYWRITGEEVHLFVDSLIEMPCSTLAHVFDTARVSLISSGLSCYGPTPGSLPLSVVQRLADHIYLDLLPGVRPLLLAEHGIELRALPMSTYMTVAEEMARGAQGVLGEWTADDAPTALVIAQNLSAFDLVSADDEFELHLEMVAAALSCGARRVLFRPHPGCSPTLALRVGRYAREGGVKLTMVPEGLPAEVVACKVPLVCAVSCDSTATIVVSEAFGFAPVSVGAELLMQRMAPFENRHRIAAVIVDAITREDTPYEGPVELQRLVDTVAYCMQPQVLPHFRAEAQSLLLEMSYEERRRYVKKRRLYALGLPPGEEPPKPAPLATRATRWLNRLLGANSKR